ncbi:MULTISPECIES: HAD family hydrolase [Thioclava]|uniref:HAD family phosphatase n=1 Tax=Thioclava kandeliae TaxID=3070818 RepID=A0ABV1SDL2_9RHOB
MIEAVVFDIGNVLLEWQPERHFDTFMDAQDRKRLFAEVDLHAMNDAVDKGGNLPDLCAALAEAHPEWREQILRWNADWLQMASPAIPHSVRLLRALRAKGIPVFALSNFGIGTFAMAEGKYDFLQEFDRRYISGHMGVIKPDPEIYRMLEADCGVAPEALLFADDRADNIKAAEARGWKGHLFTTPEAWADRLVAEGLLTPEEAI